ncbi:hypothetical protein L7F22_020703 [Adiantum nelumboides]|nr:hypothetical protein [Adiantum nelumboides]
MKGATPGSNGAEKKRRVKRRGEAESQGAAFKKPRHSQPAPQDKQEDLQPSEHLSSTRRNRGRLQYFQEGGMSQNDDLAGIRGFLSVESSSSVGNCLGSVLELLCYHNLAKTDKEIPQGARDLGANLVSSRIQILVGTPGRLVDHIQNTPGMAKFFKTVKLFVLDEADRMLDMGFRDSLDKIMKALPSGRQTLLFSATIPKEVHTIAGNALRPGYEFVDTVGSDNQDTHAEVHQECVVVPLEDQFEIIYSVLTKHINVEPQFKVLVFCVTARVTAFMFNLFKPLGLNAREIHSRKSQNQRNQVSEEFRRSKGGIILFTSDVSARGVDYPDVSLVIQIGAPSDVEQYIHRLGRTGRAGKEGEGLLVLAPWEAYFLKKLESILIRQLPAPEPNVNQKNRIRDTASQVDADIRMLAYQAWIGYYKGLKGLKLSRERLIEACQSV